MPSSKKPYRLDDSWAVLAAIDGHLLGGAGVTWLVSKVRTVGESTCTYMNSSGSGSSYLLRNF